MRQGKRSDEPLDAEMEVVVPVVVGLDGAAAAAAPVTGVLINGEGSPVVANGLAAAEEGEKKVATSATVEECSRAALAGGE